MAKYRLVLSIPSEVWELRLYGLDKEQKEELEGLDDDEISEYIWDKGLGDSYGSFVVNEDSYSSEETEDPILTVYDKDENVVYETCDPRAIKIYYFRYDPDDEFYDPDDDEFYAVEPDFVFNGVEDGAYLVENNFVGQFEMEGWFEADNFDPSKFAFYPSNIFDTSICEDDIHLCELHYDKQKIEWGDDNNDTEYPEYNVGEAKNGEFHMYRRKIDD